MNASLTSCGAPVRNLGPQYVLLSNILFPVAAAFVIVRFAYKALVAGLEFGYDDYIVFATMLSLIVTPIMNVFGLVKNGLGRDLWTLRPDQITQLLKCYYVMASVYFLQSALLKLCLIFFYLRVFPSAGVQRLLWGTVIFVVLWGIAYILAGIFTCQPIDYFWQQWDGLHKGHCSNLTGLTHSHAGISIALDFWILGIPMWQLWGLQMSRTKKVCVGLMFCLGTFDTVVSILRLRALIDFANSANPSWDFYRAGVWSTIEVTVGIIW